MEIRKSNFRTHEEFALGVSKHNPEVADALLGVGVFTTPVVMRVRAPYSVVFDCTPDQLVGLVDIEIADVVFEIENNKVVFEYGLHATVW